MNIQNNSDNAEKNNAEGIINLGGNDDGSIIEDDNVIEDECITPQDEEEHVRNSRRKKRGEQANGENKNSRNGRNNSNVNNVANRGNPTGNNVMNSFTNSRNASRENVRNQSGSSMPNNTTNRINSVSVSASATVSINGNGNASNPLRSSTMNESWSEQRNETNCHPNQHASTINVNLNNVNTRAIHHAVPGDGYYDDIYDDIDRNEITSRQNGFFNQNGSNTDSSNTSHRNLMNATNVSSNAQSVEHRTEGENKRDGASNVQRDNNNNNNNNNNNSNNNNSNNAPDQEADESLEAQSRIANPSYSEMDEVEVEEAVEEVVIIRRENENEVLNQREVVSAPNGSTNFRERNGVFDRFTEDALDAISGGTNTMRAVIEAGAGRVGAELALGFVPNSRRSSVSSHTNDNNQNNDNNIINNNDINNTNRGEGDANERTNGMMDARSVSDSLMLVTRDRMNSHSNTLQNGNLDNLTVCLQKELTCPICLDYFHLPVTMNCGHTFCRYCIGHNKLNGKSCPLCRQPLGNTLCINTIISNLVRIYNLRRKSYTLYKSIELINTVDEHWWSENFIKPQVSVSLFLRIFLNDMVSPAIFFDDLTTCIIDYFTVNNLWSKAKWVFNIRDCRVFSELIGYNKDDKEMTNERLHAWVENYITKNPSMCMRKDEKLILKLYQDRTHRIDSHIFDSAYLPNRLPWDGGRHAKSLIHMPHSSVSLSHLLFVKLENNTIGVVDCGSTIGTMVKVSSHHTLQEGDIIHIGDRLEVSISMDTNNLGMPYKGYVWNTKENKVLDRHELRELIRQENKEKPEFANNELNNAIDAESSNMEELIPSYCENIESNLLVKFEFGVNKDDVTPKSEYIDPKGVVLGRGPYAQSSYRKISVTNSNGYVSREHCLIYYDGSKPSGERWLLRDTSTLGTFLKIKPYSNPVPLPVGSIFKAGQCKIEVCSPDGPQYVQYPERAGALQNGNNQQPNNNNNNNGNNSNSNNNNSNNNNNNNTGGGNMGGGNQDNGGNNNGTNGSSNNNNNSGTDGGSNNERGANQDQSGNVGDMGASENGISTVYANEVVSNIIEDRHTLYNNRDDNFVSYEQVDQEDEIQTERDSDETREETFKNEHAVSANNSNAEHKRSSLETKDACVYSYHFSKFKQYGKKNMDKSTENFICINWRNETRKNERGVRGLEGRTPIYQHYYKGSLYQVNSLQNEYSVEYKNRRGKQTNWFSGRKYSLKNVESNTRYRKGLMVTALLGNGKIYRNRKNGTKRNRLMMSGTIVDHDTDYTVSTSGNNETDDHSNQMEFPYEKSVGYKGESGIMQRGNHQVLIKNGREEELDKILIAHKNGFKKQIIQRKRNSSESCVMENEINEDAIMELKRNATDNTEHGKTHIMNIIKSGNLRHLDSYQNCIIGNNETYQNKEWLLT